MLRAFALGLLALHLLAALCVPIVQSIRLPLFSAMKIAFALSAVSSLAGVMGWVLSIGPRWMRTATLAGVGVLVLALAVVQGAYVLTQFALGRG